jgi:hypothetical protein
MKTLNLFSIACFLTLMPAVAGLSGCATQSAAPTPLTCDEVMISGLADVSDEALAELLDDSLLNQPREKCWRPIIRQAIEDKRTIPPAHLAEAVKEFNRKADAQIFHTAVCRYLLAVTEGLIPYGEPQRMLLETYLTHTIGSARSSTDPHLKDIRVICMRLDPRLYARLFGVGTGTALRQ